MASNRVKFLNRANELLKLLKDENIYSSGENKELNKKLSKIRKSAESMVRSFNCPGPGMTATAATTLLKVGFCQELASRFVLEYCIQYKEQNISQIFLADIKTPHTNHALVYIGPVHASDGLFIGKGSSTTSNVDPEKINQELHEFISANSSGIFADPLLNCAGNSTQELNSVFEYCKKHNITHVIGIRSYLNTTGLLEFAPVMKENAMKIANIIKSKMNDVAKEEPEKSDIKSLFHLSAQVVLNNKNIFFKALNELPSKLIEKVPELEVNYKRQFCRQVKHLIDSISFTPDEKEKLFLDRLKCSLTTNTPYDSIHPILVEIGEENKKGFYSTFKKNMEPIRSQVIKLMKEYNENKNEYIKHFGKKL